MLISIIILILIAIPAPSYTHAYLKPHFSIRPENTKL